MLIKGGGLIYFIHIPRTGGRHIYNMFKHYPIEDNSNPNDKFNGMIKMHLPYPYYKTLYNFNDIKTFTVFRNPIDRILSAISYDVFINKTDIELIKKDIVSYIEKQRSNHSYHNNFFTPQINYLDINTKIWKFENGFNKDFCKWIKNNFKYNIEPISQKKDLVLDGYNKIKLSNNIIDTIKNMYRLDLNTWKDI